MDKSKELKTCMFVNRKLKETYNNLYLNKNKMYSLNIFCYSKDDNEFKYYFQINKGEIPIYKRGLNTTDIVKTHIAIYKLLLEYMSKNKFHYCTLNDGILNIYFKNNFKINITYNSEYDKLFFEDIFENYRRDIEENRALLKKN